MARREESRDGSRRGVLRGAALTPETTPLCVRFVKVLAQGVDKVGHWLAVESSREHVYAATHELGVVRRARELWGSKVLCAPAPVTAPLALGCWEEAVPIEVLDFVSAANEVVGAALAVQRQIQSRPGFQVLR